MELFIQALIVAAFLCCKILCFCRISLQRLRLGNILSSKFFIHNLFLFCSPIHWNIQTIINFTLGSLFYSINIPLDSFFVDLLIWLTTQAFNWAGDLFCRHWCLLIASAQSDADGIAPFLMLLWNNSDAVFVSAKFHDTLLTVPIGDTGKKIEINSTI